MGINVCLHDYGHLWNITFINGVSYSVDLFNISNLVSKDSVRELSVIRPEISGFSVKEVGVNMADVNRDESLLDSTLSSQVM